MADDETWEDEFARTIAPTLAPRTPSFRGQLIGASEPEPYSLKAPERFAGSRDRDVKLGYAHLKRSG